MIDGKKTQLLTASQDFTIKWWQVKRPHQASQQGSLMIARKDALLGEFRVHQASIESLAVSPSEDKVSWPCLVSWGADLTPFSLDSSSVAPSMGQCLDGTLTSSILETRRMRRSPVRSGKRQNLREYVSSFLWACRGDLTLANRSLCSGCLSMWGVWRPCSGWRTPNAGAARGITLFDAGTFPRAFAPARCTEEHLCTLSR